MSGALAVSVKASPVKLVSQVRGPKGNLWVADSVACAAAPPITPARTHLPQVRRRTASLRACPRWAAGRDQWLQSDGSCVWCVAVH